MKKFIFEYVNTLGYVLTGLVCALTAFLLFVNIYHYKEVDTKYVKSDEYQTTNNNYKEKLAKISENANSFDSNNYHGSYDSFTLNSIKGRLNLCVSKYNTSEINDILQKNEITIGDDYKFLSKFQSDIINDCIVMQIYSLNSSVDENKVGSIKSIKPFVELESKMVISDLDYVKKVIQSNSSYSFSSDYDKTNIFEMTRDSYTRIETSYSNSIDFVLAVSEWFKKTVAGEI